MNRLQVLVVGTFAVCIFLRGIETGFVANKGTFWQITDIHLDPFYSEIGNIRKECHNDNVSVDSIGHYGNFSCDAPWALVKDAIRAIKAIDPNPDFILWTGDSSAHLRTAELKWDKVYANLENITDLLTNAFTSSLIIPVIGNHDSYPANDFPFDNVKSMYQGYLSKAKWNKLIPPEETRTFHQGGYYGRFINPKLKILVLNTNLYLPYNTNKTEEDDPTGQLAWLEGELKVAKDNNIAVIITAHVPPGYFERVAVIPFLSDKFNDAFVNLLLNYSSVIFTQIYGHTHTDSFRLVSYDLPNAVPDTHAFIAPSVSPWKVPLTGMNGINPSVRLYRYSLEKKMVLDYEQYFLNLTKANEVTRANTEMLSEISTTPAGDKKPSNLLQEFTEVEETNATEELLNSPDELMPNDYANSSVKWELLYRASELYGVSNLSLAALGTIYRKIVNESDVFEHYYEMNTVGVRAASCDHACYATHVCAMRYVTTHAITQCFSRLSADPKKPELSPTPCSTVVTSDAKTETTINVVSETNTATLINTISEVTEASHKHHRHHHVTSYMSHVIIGIAVGLLVTLVIVVALAIRRWRFRSYYRYKRHFAVQS